MLTPPDLDRADLVCCVEVLEHIPEPSAALAVHNLCDLSKRWVYFSAAQPGQLGHGHVNCQPPAYWIEKFQMHGFRLAESQTAALRGVLAPLSLYWLPQNALIFERASG